VPVDHPSFRCLQRLVDLGAHVKLSAPYETSKVGAPGFDDVAALARALVAQAPDRMLWATNWPHPGQPPQDEQLFVDWLGTLVPDTATRDRILVDNPASRYGFGPVG
jgi:D-galactarolactone isomerase